MVNYTKTQRRKKYIKWFQFDDSFKTIIDGLSGVGKILIPKPSEIELMDEEDSQVFSPYTIPDPSLHQPP